jgi:hypothetical protein
MIYKFLLFFALGFILATGISIYKQKKVAGKANKQIAIANTVISNLQDKQKELENLKRQIQQERFNFQQQSYFLQNRILELQDEITGYECPTIQTLQPNCIGSGCCKPKEGFIEIKESKNKRNRN